MTDDLIGARSPVGPLTGPDAATVSPERRPRFRWSTVGTERSVEPWGLRPARGGRGRFGTADDGGSAAL